MNYISAEQFQEQPKEAQKVLLKWWKPSKGDIFVFLGDDTSRGIGVLGDSKEIQIATKGKGEYRLPLLTEGQLREFIETKLELKVRFLINPFTKTYVYTFSHDSITTHTGTDNLLQSYWKVACQIAAEVQNEK